MAIAIEWEFESKEYSYVWATAHGNLPILPVGSYINVCNDDFHFELKLCDVVTYYEIGKGLTVYLHCDVVGIS